MEKLVGRKWQTDSDRDLRGGVAGTEWLMIAKNVIKNIELIKKKTSLTS